MQALQADQSCAHIVQRRISQQPFALAGKESLNTSAYCKARLRLPENLLMNLVSKFAVQIDEPATRAWKDLYPKLIDGTTVSMPDTSANQEVYPQQQAQTKGLGFPILRLSALVSLTTGAVIDYRTTQYSGKGTGETALLRDLVSGLSEKDLLIGERLYDNYFTIALLQQNGVNFLFKANKMRRINFSQKGKDCEIVLKKPQRTKWMDKATYKIMPNELTVRVIKRKQQILITSLCHKKRYKKHELFPLYSSRWHIELDFRNIKQVMEMDVLRCKTPSMVRKEIAIYLLAYNLVCYELMKASSFARLNRRHLSFTAALRAVNLFLEQSVWTNLPTEESIYILIIPYQVGNRLGRREPRAKKRRPKAYPLLTESRVIARNRLHANP